MNRFAANLRAVAGGCLAVGAFLTPYAAFAADVTVAVAANFTAPAKELADLFRSNTGHAVDLSFGSTGQLFAQISQGAPFDIFLAADTASPRKAEKEGLAVAGSEFTYAVGQLALWSTDPALVDGKGRVLHDGKFDHIAIANPTTAPYGAAAVEAMKSLGVYDDLEPKLVMGTNIGQTYQFVSSGNAELGFVALSEAIGDDSGSKWIVPTTLYAPILQDAVLLTDGSRNAIAKSFFTFLKSPDALEIIRKYGYELDSSGE